MAHSPRTQHCSPAHGCGRPSTPCRPAAAEPRKPTGRGWCPSLCRQHCQPWVGRRHDRRPGCVLGTELQPLPVVLHLGPAPSLGWHGGAGAAVWLRTGTRASLGAGAEQMAPNGSVRVHPAGRPLADCWQPVELLGQNGSAWGEHAGPQREAGAGRSSQLSSHRPGGLVATMLAQLGLHQTWHVAEASSGWPSASGISADQRAGRQGCGCARGFPPGPAWPHAAIHAVPSTRGRVLPLLHGAAAAFPAPHILHPTCASSSASPGSCPSPIARWHHAGLLWAPARARRG